MDVGKFSLITEADYVLSRCGRFVPPVGSVVYIPKSFLLQAVLPAAPATQTFYKEITGDTTWNWRTISTALSGSPPLISAQVLKPDGHFLFNGLLDLTQIAGFGSNRYVLSRKIECPPGSKIQLNLDDNYLASGVVQPVSFLAGGAYAYYLKGGIRSRSVEQEASALPRIFAGVNQNLLAPCWMRGEGPKVPTGIRADAFTYGDGNSNVLTLTIGDNLSGKATIPIGADSDFHCRRLLFDVNPQSTIGGVATFLARIRTAGYDLTDDYMDVAQFIGSSYWAKGWDIKRGDEIQIELVLVDASGSGSITISCYADGERRRAA
jgi:hypothetical protein